LFPPHANGGFLFYEIIPSRSSPPLLLPLQLLPHLVLHPIPYVHKPYVHKMYTNPMFTNPMFTHHIFTLSGHVASPRLGNQWKQSHFLHPHWGVTLRSISASPRRRRSFLSSFSVQVGHHSRNTPYFYTFWACRLSKAWETYGNLTYSAPHTGGQL